MPIYWTCPYCSKATTINTDKCSEASHVFSLDNRYKTHLTLKSKVLCCPNPQCKEVAISAWLFKSTQYGAISNYAPLQSWNLRPDSNATPLPDYIPAALIEDYIEACKIKDLSPKASATLSRRCLQGLIRNFWGIKAKTLYLEIQQLEGKVDAITWQAIDAVRTIGNIGAHMEKDINLIVDVDPDEANALIRLLEYLFKETYIAKHDREAHMQTIIGIANAKQEAKVTLKDGEAGLRIPLSPPVPD